MGGTIYPATLASTCLFSLVEAILKFICKSSFPLAKYPGIYLPEKCNLDSKLPNQGSEMAQRVKAPVTRQGELSLTPGTHMVGESHSQSCPLTSTLTVVGSSPHINKGNKIKISTWNKIKAKPFPTGFSAVHHRSLAGQGSCSRSLVLSGQNTLLSASRRADDAKPLPRVCGHFFGLLCELSIQIATKNEIPF